MGLEEVSLASERKELEGPYHRAMVVTLVTFLYGPIVESLMFEWRVIEWYYQSGSAVGSRDPGPWFFIPILTVVGLVYLYLVFSDQGEGFMLPVLVSLVGWPRAGFDVWWMLTYDLEHFLLNLRWLFLYLVGLLLTITMIYVNFQAYEHWQQLPPEQSTNNKAMK